MCCDNCCDNMEEVRGLRAEREDRRRAGRPVREILSELDRRLDSTEPFVMYHDSVLGVLIVKQGNVETSVGLDLA